MRACRSTVSDWSTANYLNGKLPCGCLERLSSLEHCATCLKYLDPTKQAIDKRLVQVLFAWPTAACPASRRTGRGIGWSVLEGPRTRRLRGKILNGWSGGIRPLRRGRASRRFHPPQRYAR